MTDIPTDSSGRPRWFFRERSWVKSFMLLHGLEAGAKLLIHRISPTEYEIAPATRKPITILASSRLPGMNDGLASNGAGHNGHVRGRRGKNGDLNKLSFEDRPVHEWYRFVLSYPPHLVRDYLTRFGLRRNQRVLDPFCGTGTTLVECQKQGIPSIGIEANAMACFSNSPNRWAPGV